MVGKVRRYKRVTFHLIQMFGEHKLFGIYHARMGKAEYSVCAFCDLNDVDSVEHIPGVRRP